MLDFFSVLLVIPSKILINQDYKYKLHISRIFSLHSALKEIQPVLDSLISPQRVTAINDGDGLGPRAFTCLPGLLYLAIKDNVQIIFL